MLPLSLFYNNKHAVRHAKKSSSCKPCENIRTKRKRIRRANESIDYFIKETLYHSKANALKRKLSWDLKLEEIVILYHKQDKKCAITNQLLTHIRGKGQILTNLSIDRIDSSKDYELSNVQLVCFAVNIMKYSFDEETFKFWISVIHSKLLSNN
jgi:hypothetical protein